MSPTINKQWTSIINLQAYNSEFVAQGITQANDKFLLHSVHEKDKKSYILIFNMHKNYLLTNKWLMPIEATHTSDLEFKDNMLYAVDYKSNIIYIFDFEKSLKENKLILFKKIKTLIKGSGSASILKIKDEDYYVFSSFLYNNDLYFIKLYDLLTNSTGILSPNDIIFSLKSEYFIQGLYSVSETLFIAVNKFGQDLIYEISIKTYLSTGLIKDSIINIYNAPTDMVEDILIYKNLFITSGEDTNKIYVSNYKHRD